MVGLAQGSLLARYRVDSLLGEGAMGAVYRARQLDLDRPVALKVIVDALAGDPSFRERFQREAMAAAAIDHPNVVPVYEAGEVEGRLFLAMRLVEGADLGTLIAREGLLEPRAAVPLVRQIADALDAAHARGLVHRDVKPANVLITGGVAGGHAYLTDFGIARQLRSSTRITRPGMLVGTVDYIAPELVRGDPAGPAADVYALGCVLFEALTGQVPFPREDELAVLVAQRDEPPPPLRDLIPAPVALERVIERALAKRPGERYPSAAAFGQAAQAALEPSAPPQRAAPRSAAATTAGSDLKGLEDPARSWQESWRPGAERRPLPAALARQIDLGKFVGRTAELEQLAEAWERSSAGELGAVLVAGEPGVGKTRLVAEQACAVATEGGRVLFGRADEQVASPFGPFVSALRRLLEDLEADVLAAHVALHGGELARLVPELAARVPGLPPPRTADPDTERLRLREAVVALIGTAAVRVPTLLVMDDLHWADSATLGLLLHLLRGPDAPVLVAATYRATAIDQQSPLRVSLADLVREPRVERLELSNLTEADVGSLVETAAVASPAALARRIHSETGGNALFATELLRHIVQSGEGAESGIPPTVRDLVRQRLERIDGGATEILTPATVIGRSFEAKLLGRLTDSDEDRLLDVLERAEQAALVEEDARAPGRFFFRHAVIHAALSETIGASRRRSLHRRVADDLERRGGRGARHLGELARHWLEAGDARRGGEAAVRAGDAALALLAPEEAAGWYRRALEVHEAQDEPDQSRRAELMILLGEAERRAGSQAFRAHLLEAGRVARELNDPARLARAALANNRGMHSRTGFVDDERIELLEAALEMGDAIDDRQRALLLATTSSELWSGDHDRRRLLSDEALAVARRAGDDRVLAEVIYRRAFATAEPATLQERLGLTAELVELTDRLGDPLLRLLASVERSRAAIESADLKEAVRHAERQAELAAECGDAFGRHAAGWARGWPHALAGRYEQAERAAEAALAESLQSEQPDALAFYGALIAVIRWDQGRLGELADGIVAHAEGPDGLPAHRALAAMALADSGRLEEAGHFIDVAAARRFALPVDTIWLPGMVMWAEACVLCGRADGAMLLLRRLLPWRDQVAFSGLAVHGGVARVAAELAAVVGWDEADSLFAQAEDVHERLGAPALLARTRAGWACWLSQRGEDTRAHELSVRAREAAEACGCPGLARHAAAGLTAR